MLVNWSMEWDSCLRRTPLTSHICAESASPHAFHSCSHIAREIAISLNSFVFGEPDANPPGASMIKLLMGEKRLTLAP